MRIWDIHCHPEGSRVPGRTLTEKVENLIQIAGRLGIERLGLFLRISKERDKIHPQFQVGEKEVVQILTRYPNKLFGFLWLTLWNDTVENHIANLNRWIADGPMVGMKLAGPDGVCSLPIYDPVFERAAALKAVIYVHAWLKVGTGPVQLDSAAGASERLAAAIPGGLYVPNESKPQDVAELAARRPETPVICGHSGGDWELGFRAVRAVKNVFVEISGSFPTRGMVEMAVRELGAERVIYGSDIPGRSFASQLAKVYGAAIPDREKQLIFRDNLKGIMTPILKAKGISIEG